MKTKQLLATVLGTLLIAPFLSSCLKNDNDKTEFEIVSDAYIVKKIH